jgi:uncharacterized LabA/DUF88 family protein
MDHSVAILIDGGYFKKNFHLHNRKSPQPDDVIEHCDRLMKSEKLAKSELFRIFYYDCLPYDGECRHPFTGVTVDYSKTDQYKNNMDFFDKLKVKENIAFRQGTLQLNGWKINEARLSRVLKEGYRITEADIKEDFKQKTMDVKVGLDIAWLSSKHLVDEILLVTGDTDFVPAMKFARREGVRVYLNILSADCSVLLKEHADLLVKLDPLV